MWNFYRRINSNFSGFQNGATYHVEIIVSGYVDM